MPAHLEQSPHEIQVLGPRQRRCSFITLLSPSARILSSRRRWTIAFGGSWTFRLLRGSPCRTWIELLCHLVWAYVLYTINSNDCNGRQMGNSSSQQPVCGNLNGCTSAPQCASRTSHNGCTSAQQCASRTSSGTLGSALRGGGGKATRDRKAQDLALLQAFQSVLQVHCGGAPTPPPQQPRAKGQRVNQQSFYKPTQRPSKGKRKQQQRAAKSSDEPLDDDASR